MKKWAAGIAGAGIAGACADVAGAEMVGLAERERLRGRIGGQAGLERDGGEVDLVRGEDLRLAEEGDSVVYGS